MEYDLCKRCNIPLTEDTISVKAVGIITPGGRFCIPCYDSLLSKGAIRSARVRRLKLTPAEKYKKRVVRCGVYKKHQNGDILTLKDLKKGLPGMPWPRKDLKPLNIGQDAKNWGKLWTPEETLKLKELFDFYGFADAERWTEIAKNNFERTIYGIEQQLRFVASGEDWIFEAVVERRMILQK